MWLLAKCWKNNVFSGFFQSSHQVWLRQNWSNNCIFLLFSTFVANMPYSTEKVQSVGWITSIPRSYSLSTCAGAHSLFVHQSHGRRSIHMDCPKDCTVRSFVRKLAYSLFSSSPLIPLPLPAMALAVALALAQPLPLPWPLPLPSPCPCPALALALGLWLWLALGPWLFTLDPWPGVLCLWHSCCRPICPCPSTRPCPCYWPCPCHCHCFVLPALSYVFAACSRGGMQNPAFSQRGMIHSAHIPQL
jgi:hypothetical protein